MGNTYFNKLGGKLREIRLDRGYTLEFVADKVGLTPKAIHFYESGLRKISNPTIYQLCQVYHYDINKFWDETVPFLGEE